ncbi:MAG: aminoglycoside phosphotransferase family protein [Umezawaea sp.]
MTVFEVARSLGFTDVRPLARGLEFAAYLATGSDGARVVLRVPLCGRFQSNANDPDVDTRALLRREELITHHAAAAGLPVAEPVRLVLGAPDVLVSRYVPDDGGGADPARLGALLARLHRVPAPALEWAEDVLPQRIARRWQELSALVDGLPPAPPGLRARLAGRPTGSLLHLDVRAPNLRCANGEVLALLDWSNALVGDPALELARLTEFAALPENGLDLPGILAGYGPVPGTDHPSFLVYRLDAAVMLALVFLSEAPDESRAARAVDRVHALLVKFG